MSKFAVFEEKLKERKTYANVAVVNAVIETAVDAVVEAARKGFAKPVLIGAKDKIEAILKEIKADVECEIIDAKDESDAAKKAVELAAAGKVDIIMKGSITTGNFMRPILNKETGIVKPGALVSHISVFSIDTYKKFLIVTDVAIKELPTLDEKIKILKNAVELAKGIDITKPKVAVISAAETVNMKLPSSTEAAILAKMGERGQLGDAIVEGPMALDLAVSEEACEEKNFHSEVGADADIILCPEIDAGNIFYKCMTKLAKADLAALLSGTKVPVVLTSRGDTAQIKYDSLLLALMTVKK